ncbi:MAG: ABC transporter substrate-binding protein [Deltaproteobacteria bacterium]|nr:ABC transporter substrate-binding protein [Deltaproteobacteria bacterium]
MFVRFVSLALISIFALSLFSTAASAEDKTLKVGLVLGLTGGASQHADAIRNGVELAATELRASGWTVELTYEDDQTNAGKTVTALRALIARGHKLFIGPTWSFQIHAALPILAASDSIAIVPGGSADISGGSAKGVFYLSPKRDGQILPISEFLKQRNYRRAIILYPLGDWGVIHNQVFRAAAGAAGLEIAGSHEYEYGMDASGHKAFLAKVRAAKADVILMTGAPADSAQLVRARNDLKLDTAILGTDTFLGAVNDGLLSSSDRMDNVFALALPVNPEFSKKHVERYHALPRQYADRGYDALLALARAIEHVPDGSIPRLDAYLREELSFAGASGEVDLDDNRDLIGGDFILQPALASGLAPAPR